MTIEFEADEERIRRHVSQAQGNRLASLAFDLDSLTQELKWVEAGVNVLAWRDRDTVLVSLLGMAFAFQKVVALETNGSVEFDTGGGTPDVFIARRPTDEDINVTGTNGIDVTFARAQFVEQTNAFEHRARAYLVRVAPELLDDPVFGWWFREEPRPSRLR